MASAVVTSYHTGLPVCLSERECIFESFSHTLWNNRRHNLVIVRQQSLGDSFARYTVWNYGIHCI